MLISLYTVRVIMNELGIDGFGIYNVVAGFVTMVGFIGTTITVGIQRFYNYEIGKHGDQAAPLVYTAAIKIQSIISLGIVLVFESFGLWYIYNVMNLPAGKMTEIMWLYQFSIISLLLNVLIVPFQAFTISKEHMNFYAVLSVLETLLKLGGVYCLSLFGSYRLAIYGGIIMFITLLNFLSFYIFCKKKYPYLRTINISGSGIIRSILSFSGWNVISAFANIGRGQGVNLLLNYFFGVAINAANAIVTNIYSAVQLFATNICIAFRPQLTEAYARNDFGTTRTMFFYMSKFAFIMVMAICIPIYLELPFILKIWLGTEIPKFTEIFTKITLLTILIGSLNTPVSVVIYAHGNIRSYIIVYSCVCLCVPFGWIAFHYFNAPPTAVFYITLALMIVIQICSLCILKKRLDYSYLEYIKTVLIPILIFSALAAILPILTKIIINNPGFTEFFLVGLSDIIGSSIVIYSLILTKSQRKILRSKFNNVCQRHQSRSSGI